MADISFEELIELIDQLSAKERAALIQHLEMRQIETMPQEAGALDLLVFDVGPWPRGMTLRREDEYGDDGR